MPKKKKKKTKKKKTYKYVHGNAFFRFHSLLITSTCLCLVVGRCIPEGPCLFFLSFYFSVELLSFSFNTLFLFLFPSFLLFPDLSLFFFFFFFFFSIGGLTLCKGAWEIATYIARSRRSREVCRSSLNALINQLVLGPHVIESHGVFFLYLIFS